VSSPKRIEVGADTVEYTADGAGEPVVIVHGWGSSRADWDRVIAELEPRHRVVVLDLPGFGGSTSSNEAVSIASYAADVAGVMDAEGIDRAVVVGHSMGGAIALEFAALYPGRASKVVGVDTYHYLQLYPAQDDESTSAFLTGFVQDLPASVDALVALSSVPTTPERVREHVRQSTLSAQYPLVITALESTLRWDLDAALDRVDVPVHVIAAKELLSPVAVERYGNRMHFSEFPAMSHYMPLEDPVGTAQRIEEIIAID
jgi:pimeloyl-ACP methyl ester carboxylesterase